MSVIIKKFAPTPVPTGEGDSPSRFKRWYDKNKDNVAKRRKARYANDPQYRDKVKKHAADQKRVLLTWDDVASRCGAGTKLDELKHQCECGLFPNPGLYGDVEAFTIAQFQYIKELQAIIRKYGKHSQQAGNHSSLMYANWS